MALHPDKQLSLHLGEELDTETVWEEACLVNDERIRP